MLWRTVQVRQVIPGKLRLERKRIISCESINLSVPSSSVFISDLIRDFNRYGKK